MTAVEVLRVFVDDHDRHGTLLGVVLDGGAMPDSDQRQRRAAALDLSEAIFIDDIAGGQLWIFTPATELATPSSATR